jgi:hypothetical protein
MDDPNDLHHVFGNPRHNLDQFVRQNGGEELAGQEIDAAGCVVNGIVRIGTAWSPL